MTDYMVLAIDEEKEEIIDTSLAVLVAVMKESKGDIVYVGSLEKVKNAALRIGSVFPFSSIVSSFEALDEAVEEKEKMIFFDCGKRDAFSICLSIMDNRPCVSFLYFGNHEKYYTRLSLEASPNTLSRLILASDGNRLFPYPRVLECSMEAVMDTLVNVDSLTSNPFFRKDRPFILIKEKRSDVDYQEIVERAALIGIPVSLRDEGEYGPSLEARAVLSFSTLGHGDDLSVYFGLPFWYINAVRLPEKAITAGLKITRIIQRENI